MNKRSLYIIIFIVAIIGLFIVQYQFLRVGLSLAKIQFQQKIDAASLELKKDLYNENELTFLIVESFEGSDYFKLDKDSLQQGSSHFMYDLIKRRLESNKINTDFSYRLYSEDELISLESPYAFETDESSINYSMMLEGYLPKELEKPLVLQLKFQDLNTYFLSQLRGLLIPSVLFIVIIVLVMIWVFRLFFRQGDLITITNDFINNLTHELKTPVFSIGLATKLLEKNVDEDQKPLVLQIRKQLNQLNEHIDQVLGLANLEHKEFIEMSPVDLRPELLECCENFEQLSLLEGFSFKYDLENGCYMLKASSFHFINMINNLLDNAKKYSQTPEISLRAFTKNQELVIEISDNGIGLSKKDRNRIFNKFYRVPEGDLHKTKGYGLGLNYVKEIIKRHKGKIKLESELEVGTKITIFIPLNE